MSKPTSPERDLVLAQRSALQAIRGGADWHTRIGQRVALHPLAEQDPAAHLALASVEVSDIGEGMGEARVTWQAIIPLSGEDDSLQALGAVADLRSALVSACSRGPQEAGVLVTMRPDGSNYAVVRYTVSDTFAIEGNYYYG